MKSLGLIEVIGFVSAVEASDVCLKAANVNLSRIDRVGGGIVTVSIVGDVGAVKAAVDAAQLAVERIGTLRSAHVIPRLNSDVEEYLFKPNNDEPKHKIDEVSSDSKKSEDTIEEIETLESNEIAEFEIIESQEVTEIQSVEADEVAGKQETAELEIEITKSEAVKELDTINLKEEVQEKDTSKLEKETSDLSKISVKELKAKIKTLDPSISTNTLKRMKKEELVEFIDKMNREDK
nr:BMC domain-containing protein [Clostridioides mangenotii]